MPTKIEVDTYEAPTPRALSLTKLPRSEQAAYAGWILDGQELQDDLGPEPLLNLVEKACVLSHANALRHLLQSEHSAAVILEDDAEFGEGLEHLIGSIDWWPEDVVLLKLDQPFPRKRLMGPPCGRTPDRRDLRENIRWSSGAVGYIATRAAAGKDTGGLRK